MRPRGKLEGYSYNVLSIRVNPDLSLLIYVKESIKRKEQRIDGCGLDSVYPTENDSLRYMLDPHVSGLYARANI